MDKSPWVVKLLIAISLVAVVGVFFVPPIAQSTEYHNFADARAVFGIANFWNVVSNGLFALAGVMGLRSVSRGGANVFPAQLATAYRIFFIGVLLVAFGSAYYHLAPDNTTLVWDRLPMTVGFMALFAIIVGEYIALEAGRKLLWPLIIFGAGAVGYWWYSEVQGQGDLRAYILVQFLPMLLIPLILLLFAPRYGSPLGYWLLLGFYVLAKICEHWDEAIFNVGLGISGHTLKHFLAAIGVLILALCFNRRNLQS